jgi:hypothetical protein
MTDRRGVPPPAGRESFPRPPWLPLFSLGLHRPRPVRPPTSPDWCWCASAPPPIRRPPPHSCRLWRCDSPGPPGYRCVRSRGRILRPRPWRTSWPHPDPGSPPCPLTPDLPWPTAAGLRPSGPGVSRPCWWWTRRSWSPAFPPPRRLCLSAGPCPCWGCSSGGGAGTPRRGAGTDFPGWACSPTRREQILMPTLPPCCF